MPYLWQYILYLLVAAYSVSKISTLCISGSTFCISQRQHILYPGAEHADLRQQNILYLLAVAHSVSRSSTCCISGSTFCISWWQHILYLRSAHDVSLVAHSVSSSGTTFCIQEQYMLISWQQNILYFLAVAHSVSRSSICFISGSTFCISQRQLTLYLGSAHSVSTCSPIRVVFPGNRKCSTVPTEQTHLMCTEFLGGTGLQHGLYNSFRSDSFLFTTGSECLKYPFKKSCRLSW